MEILYIYGIIKEKKINMKKKTDLELSRMVKYHRCQDEDRGVKAKKKTFIQSASFLRTTEGAFFFFFPYFEAIQT